MIADNLENSPAAADLIDVGDTFPTGRFDRIVSRYDAVINFKWEDRVVSIVGTDICAGAMRIRLDLYDLAGIRTVEHKACQVLINDDTVIHYGRERIYCSEMGQFASALADDTISRLSETLHRNSRGNDLCFLMHHRISGNCVSAIDHVFKDRFHKAYDRLVRGKISEGIGLFQGCGYGLTPSGDDFICGLLMGMYLLDAKKELSKIRQMIYLLSVGANALTNTMQHQAYHGWFDADWKGLALALRDGSPYLETAVQAVLQSGETSGADKLAGFVTAFIHDWKRM